MHSQRAGGGENPAERSLLNGPLRAQSKAGITKSRLSILRREGIRQLPEICWYFVESGRFPEARWHRGTGMYPSLADYVLDGFFVLHYKPARQMQTKD